MEEGKSAYQQDSRLQMENCGWKPTGLNPGLDLEREKIVSEACEPLGAHLASDWPGIVRNATLEPPQNLLLVNKMQDLEHLHMLK